MYYFLSYHTPNCLFSTAEDAFHILQICHQYLMDHNCTILDYLLLPNSLQLVVQGRIRQYQMINLMVDPINEGDLLFHFARLGRLGKSYPFCGSYELYHASNCYAALGKAGSNTLPLPLGTILKAKRRYASKKSRSIACDEIA